LTTAILPIIILIAFTLIVGLAVRSVFAIELDLAGDFGTNTKAKQIVTSLAKGNECLLGLGDYQYQDSVSVENQKLWDSVKCKVGVPGNHELEKNEAKDWGAKNFAYGDRGYQSWKLLDRDPSKPSVAVIGINTYTDFQKGSAQYDFIAKKIDQFQGRKDISWIIVASHEPIFTPTTGGGHGPNEKLRDVLLPLIKGIPNVIVAAAHNHITAYGVVQNTTNIVCGGGGKGGDTLGKLNGFEYATAKDFGHCDLSLLPNNLKVALVGTDGTVKQSFVLNRKY
jgi:Calcineurin-like phosphoesterase